MITELVNINSIFKTVNGRAQLFIAKKLIQALQTETEKDTFFWYSSGNWINLLTEVPAFNSKMCTI